MESDERYRDDEERLNGEPFGPVLLFRMTPHTVRSRHHEPCFRQPVPVPVNTGELFRDTR